MLPRKVHQSLQVLYLLHLSPLSYDNLHLYNLYNLHLYNLYNLHLYNLYNLHLYNLYNLHLRLRHLNLHLLRYYNHYSRLPLISYLQMLHSNTNTNLNKALVQGL
jgi:hypothetical protein